MKNIEIKINRETRMVDLSKTIIGNDGENLQGNLIFSFVDTFVNGQGRLEYGIGGEKRYALLEKVEETYVIPIKSVMTKQGQIDMQLVITEGLNDTEIPIFKSNIFYVTCKKSINAETEEPDEYLQWIEIANTKLNRVDKVLEIIKTDGNGTKYLSDDGTYKFVQGGGTGEGGTKEVHIGSDEPTGEEVIWIDPSEETDIDLSEYAKKTDIPDISNFITKDVNDLINYYNKESIDNMLGDIETLLGGI